MSDKTEEAPAETPKEEPKEEPPKEEPKVETTDNSSSSTPSKGMSKGVKITLICVGSFIVLAVLTTVLIGINMKNHMLKVQEETGKARQAALDKAKNRDPASYQSAIEAKQAAELKAKQEAELAELAKAKDAADLALARDKVDEEDLKKANMAIVVAGQRNKPTNEKYITNPQYRTAFYNDKGMRGFNTIPGNDAFIEKFIELTKDGVRFDVYGNRISS